MQVLIKNRFKNAVADFCVVNYQKIDPSKIISPEFSLQNRACHFNAVTAARAGRADSVWLVMAGNNHEMVVHFINSKGGKFFDETWFNQNHEYRIIRKITEPEYANVYEILIKTKSMFYDLFGGFFDKKRFARNNHCDL